MADGLVRRIGQQNLNRTFASIADHTALNEKTADKDLKDHRRR